MNKKVCVRAPTNDSFGTTTVLNELIFHLKMKHYLLLVARYV